MSNESRVRAALSKPIHPMVVRVTAAVMLGAATTVAVAWVLALFVDGSSWARSWPSYEVALQIIPTPYRFTPDGVYFAQATRRQRWGTDIVEVGVSWANDGRPPWGSPQALVEGTSFEGEVKEKIARSEPPTALWRADGWPLMALSAESRWGSSSGTTVKVAGGVLIGSNNASPGDVVRALPLQPMWSGLVIDSVLYIFVWFAIFSLGDIRSILRRRRGLCGRCGYKLRPEQERCSECGEAVTRRR